MPRSKKPLPQHPLIRRWRNLIAVPSYHYHPVFAQAVAAAFRVHVIQAVALEVPDAAAKEMEWAHDCWPAPVASVTALTILPFLPGDSMLEGFRLARKHNVPVHFVDLFVQDAITRPGQPLPGPEFAPRLGALFQETVEGMLGRHRKGDGDSAREAHMARRLSQLLAQHETVLWIGGMAHWEAIVDRLTNTDFAAPAVLTVQSAAFARCRLRPSALHEISGRLPHLVGAYARRPENYDEAAALQALALRVLRSGGKGGETVDVVRMLTYARNLAATSALRETPGLIDLLTSASSTLGNEYAARFFEAAMREVGPRIMEECPSLTFQMDDRECGYQLNGRWISAEPYQKSEIRGGGAWLACAAKVGFRLKSATPYADLPDAGWEPSDWSAFPPDEESYEAFIRHVLLLASRKMVREAKSEPFSTGLRDGIDVRATVRNWSNGEVHVRVDEGRSLNITNGAIDYVSDSEDAAMLRGVRAPSRIAIGLLDPRSPRFNEDHDTGWLDPDCLHVGGVSREATPGEILQEDGEPCLVVRRQREFSFVTLDVPNWYRGHENDRKDFIGRVTLPLASLPKQEDNLYGWLRVMFSFCRGKPFAYFSKYLPSARIHAVAAEFGVKVIHIPLSVIPSRLLEMHRRFRFLLLSSAQKKVLLERIAEGRRAWA